MTVANSDTLGDAKEYLDYEKISVFKQDYRQEEVYEIDESSDLHDSICVNLISLLKSKSRALGYRVNTGRVKVTIDRENIVYYPDVIVTSDDRDRGSENFKRYPRLIVEVMSPETEAFDRGDKFADYRKLPSLQEYVLISQERLYVECFRRNSEGLWILYPYGEGEEVYFASINFQTPIIALYEDLSLPLEARYSFEHKIRDRKYTKYPINRSIISVTDDAPTQIATHIPLTTSAKNNKSSLNNLWVAGALILGFAGSNVHNYWQSILSKSNLSSGSITQANAVVASPQGIPSEKLEPSLENQKDKTQENEPKDLLPVPMVESDRLDAKEIIASINRIQKGFYLENGRFASTWEDLGFNIESKEQDYEYKIAWSDRHKTIVTATAKKPEDKSYTGIVFAEGQSAVDKICETDRPSTIPPVIPEAVNKDMLCPPGASIVSSVRKNYEAQIASP